MRMDAVDVSHTWRYISLSILYARDYGKAYVSLGIDFCIATPYQP